MEGADIRAAVIAELDRHVEPRGLPAADLTDDTRLDRVGIDSMTVVAIVARLEARLRPAAAGAGRFHPGFPETVGDLVELMLTCGGSGREGGR